MNLSGAILSGLVGAFVTLLCMRGPLLFRYLKEWVQGDLNTWHRELIPGLKSDEDSVLPSPTGVIRPATEELKKLAETYKAEYAILTLSHDGSHIFVGAYSPKGNKDGIIVDLADASATHIYNLWKEEMALK